MASAPNPTESLDYVVDRLAQLYPPGATKKMSENGNGQFQAIRVEVDAVKDQFDSFKGDINRRFSELSNEVHNVGQVLSKFIQDQGSRGGDGVYKILTLIGGSLTIALIIIGAFGNLAKTNLDDHNTYTNKAVDQTNVAIDKLAKAMSENVVPRNEFGSRVDPIAAEVHRQAGVQDHHSTQIATAIAEASNLKADVERMKGDIVTRRENEGHWDDFQNRLNLLSNRVNDNSKAIGGGDLAEQLKQLRDQFYSLQGKFISAPK